MGEIESLKDAVEKFLGQRFDNKHKIKDIPFPEHHLKEIQKYKKKTKEGDYKVYLTDEIEKGGIRPRKTKSMLILFYTITEEIKKRGGDVFWEKVDYLPLWMYQTLYLASKKIGIERVKGFGRWMVERYGTNFKLIISKIPEEVEQWK